MGIRPARDFIHLSVDWGAFADCRALTSGQLVSLLLFTLVSTVMGIWAARISRGTSALTFTFFGCSFSAGPVVGVGFGGLTIAFMFGIPFLFVAVAWRKAVKAASDGGRNDR
jgi:hypothetical protein